MQFYFGKGRRESVEDKIRIDIANKLTLILGLFWSSGSPDVMLRILGHLNLDGWIAQRTNDILPSPLLRDEEWMRHGERLCRSGRDLSRCWRWGCWRTLHRRCLQRSWHESRGWLESTHHTFNSFLISLLSWVWMSHWGGIFWKGTRPPELISMRSTSY